MRSTQAVADAERGYRVWSAGSGDGASRGPDASRGVAARATHSSSPRSRSASAPSRGRRRTPTCARRSTSSSTTRAAAVELDAGAPLLQVPGERNEMRYVPRGVSAVISPWNFPLAIPCGMTAAALATGNAVVLKPAEQSPGLRAAARPGAARGRRPRVGDLAAARRGRGREPRSFAIPGCRRSPSPAPAGRASRSCAAPPSSRRASATSSA